MTPPPPRRSGSVRNALRIAVAVLIAIATPWRFLGPHYYYDVVRLARRGRSTVLRVLYILALFGGLCAVYLKDVGRSETLSINQIARVSQDFAFALFTVQNIAVLVLTPAYLGSAIAEERERRALELLFTTQLSDTQIVLGKFFARILHLIGFVLAGLPVVSLVQFWGGVDLALILGNLAYTILLILSVGSFCLLLSTLIKSVTGAVLTAYAILLPSASCCLGALHGGQVVLQDESSGVPLGATVQGIWLLAIPHGVTTIICLVVAVLSLRDRASVEWTLRAIELPERAWPTEYSPPTAPQPLPAAPAHGHQRPPQDVFGIPYILPPIQANVLLWKERHLGGPSLFWSPVVWVPLMPFLMVAASTLIFWFVLAWSVGRSELFESRQAWAGILAFFYWLFLILCVLSVSFRAAATVARERQQDTLEPLLLLPVERRDILLAKWLGCLFRAWPWAVLMMASALLGAFLGAFHPFSAVMLCLGPWPMILCFASLALWLSVSVATLLRAYLAIVLIIVFLVGCTVLGLPALSYLEAFRFAPAAEVDLGRVLLAVAATALYGLLGGVSWLLALLRFDDRRRHGK